MLTARGRGDSASDSELTAYIEVLSSELFRGVVVDESGVNADRASLSPPIVDVGVQLDSSAELTSNSELVVVLSKVC